MTTSQDLGPLDWRIPITDAGGRPTSEFQRRWNTQRNNNTLIGTITLGVGAPTGVPKDGAQYVDRSVTPYVYYLGYLSVWHQVSAKFFTDLADVPANYTSSAGKLVRVNPGATGLEFTTLATALDAISTTQGAVLYRNATSWVVLPPGAAGQVLSTGGAGANPSWITPAGGGGGGGLYNQLMSGTPTMLSTGFNTAVNGTIADTTTGVTIKLTSGWAGSLITAPAPPYIKTFLVALGGNTTGALGVGFSNGTAVQFIYIDAAGHQLVLISGNTFGSYVSTQYGPTATGVTLPAWFQLEDDGTTVYFRVSGTGGLSSSTPDKQNFFTAYSVTKASGFLGASGYTKIGPVFASSAGGTLTLMAYQ